MTYPYPGFPELGDFESAKPVRTMIADVWFRGLDIDTAAERACVIMNNLLARKCNPETDTVHQVSEVDAATMRQTITYAWNQSVSCKSADVLLPPSIEVKPSYVVRESTMGTAFTAVAGLGIFVIRKYPASAPAVA